MSNHVSKLQNFHKKTKSNQALAASVQSEGVEQDDMQCLLRDRARTGEIAILLHEEEGKRRES